MTFCKETNFKGTTIIGKIPINWEVVRIGEVCGFRRGFSYRSDQITENRTNTRFITINDYQKEGGFKQDNEKLYLRDEIEPDYDFILSEDDVLIANTDMSRGFIIGAPIHIESVEGEPVYSMDSTKLIFDKNKVNGKFLFYLLKHEKVRRKMKTFAQGTNVLHLNHELVKSLQFPLPSLSEQRAIVRVLGVVDLAVAKAGEVIARTERLKKGLMQTLLTQGIGHKEYKQTSIGTIPKEWKTAKIRDICDAVGGGTPSRRNPKYWNGVIPWISPEDMQDFEIHDSQEHITEEGLNESSTKLIKSNSILVVFRSGILKRRIPIAINRVAVTINQDLKALMPSGDLKADFLAYYLKSVEPKILQSVKTGSTVQSILPERFFQFEIGLPPLSEQTRIVDILTAVDRKLNLEREEMVRLERVKRGLMDLLLTGKIRVKVD